MAQNKPRNVGGLLTSMPSEAKTAFLSYSRKDSEFALKLAKDLKAAGAEVWMDQLDIQPGAAWDRSVQRALQSSAILLVVLSPDSVASETLLDEISFAVEQHKRVIPVLYRDCKMPVRLRDLQLLDLTSDYEHGLGGLLKALGGEINQRSERSLGPFEYDVFISHADLDNELLPGEARGWVTNLQQTLSMLVTMRLGRRVKILCNSDPVGKDPFAQEISRVLSNTALFISVISPLYVRSEWCMREAQEFCKTAEQTGGLVIDSFSRALKVLKLPVESEGNLPEIMKQTLGYPLYDSDYSGASIELVGEKFHARLAKLAHNVAALLRVVEGKARPEGAEQAHGEEGRRLAAEKAKEEEELRAGEQQRLKQVQEAAVAELPRVHTPANGPASDTVRQAVTFICYSHEDAVFARKLAQDLRNKGAHVWMDKLDIRAGQPYRKKIDEALRSCERMIVIISPASVDSDEVTSEYTSFLKRRKAVIPVLHKECEMPYRLDTVEYADFFSGEYEEALEALLLSLMEE